MIDDPFFWLLAAVALGVVVAGLAYQRRRNRRADERADQRVEAWRLAELNREAALDRAAEIDADAAREARAQAEADAERQAHVEAERRAAAEAKQRAAEEQALRERAAVQAEDERIARVEAERQAAQRAAADQADAESAAAERAAAERAAAERAAAERAAAERAVAEQAAAAQAEAQRQAEAQALAERGRLAAQAVAAEQAAQAEAERQRAAAVEPPLAAKSAGQTLVMVADDSKVVRIKTGRLLAQHHYQVCYANDGLEAAQLLQTQVPDVVITDVEMPGMDGFELTRHIRNSPQMAHIPVIMITAADDRHREHADAAGVSVLMGKPYPDDTLITHIRLVMGQEAALASG